MDREEHLNRVKKITQDTFVGIIAGISVAYSMDNNLSILEYLIAVFIMMSAAYIGPSVVHRINDFILPPED